MRTVGRRSKDLVHGAEDQLLQNRYGGAVPDLELAISVRARRSNVSIEVEDGMSIEV